MSGNALGFCTPAPSSALRRPFLNNYPKVTQYSVTLGILEHLTYNRLDKGRGRWGSLAVRSICKLRRV